ncbi:hypothetical protein DQ238_10655 [Geodermatophilus sp. TF02-6]|uniref:hypothetical protein n=1 Tax=Geodermatophilus sp. TF02-6 TaxID=2250575 RepID=UPI000DE866BB|nr:hypothetical protein [Geodermatophilus sp. TF02-6]RBY78862.1 hypothetical protein DQ238_10655 [Geodermatophilus sp. TF02-6]
MPDLLASLADHELVALRMLLEQLGFLTGLLVECPDDELDLRLQVTRDGQDPLVEVLLAAPCVPAPARWEAVRVGDGVREVWRGPERTRSGRELGDFVGDLLSPLTAELARRYCRLG